MSWTSLGEPIPSGLEHFWYLPLQGKGGKLWIRLPIVAETKSIYLGIGNNNNTPPGRFKGQLATLEPFEQYLSFDVPPFLENPFIGIRFQAEAIAIEPFYLLQEFLDMTFIEAQIPAPLPTLAAVPPQSGYSPGNAFILASTGETITLTTDEDGAGPVWLGQENLERLSLVPQVVSDATADAAVNTAELVRWSSWTGGGKYLTGIFLNRLEGNSSTQFGYSLQTSSAYVTNGSNVVISGNAVIDLMAGTVPIIPGSAETHGFFWLKAVSSNSSKIGLEVRFRRQYAEGETE